MKPSVFAIMISILNAHDICLYHFMACGQLIGIFMNPKREVNFFKNCIFRKQCVAMVTSYTTNQNYIFRLLFSSPEPKAHR